MNSIVIIGAGQTGRGFLAPIIKSNENCSLTFIDKNKQLIEQLNKQKEYKIHYYDEDKEDQVIHNFNAIYIEDKEAIETIATADLVLTAVNGNNIIDLVNPFQQATAIRKKEKLMIICCENGVNVKQPLVDATINAHISEAAVFCTTLDPQKNDLSLDSQFYPDLPYDVTSLPIQIKLQRFHAEQNFASLIQRKIYTYNCLSACISYLGAYKGYESYADAANDPTIDNAMRELLKSVNYSISKEYNIPLPEQETFAKYAISKFQNKAIVDTITRNARNAKRKVGSSERIMMPIKLCLKYQQPIHILEVVLATAFYYGIHIENDSIDILVKASEVANLNECYSNTKEILKALEDKTSIEQIL
ncbi:2-dehydropantoate 2-reductase N-terminal domain-containing protein [Breznakia pachnodae]|uniref:Mannitol-1-phosphate 5-dehydrogenase n=1 Tax=Breznakia pachnodae TaxID=265178 RepID=A0ABU0E0C2_9FIRM|nr:2-dehydropantoate 2-reductase N-terminal domain-containing protein [Breznakia pachnodae]MDQ0360337.1 mannitol-1-phosphate 5-dehydrogenase [Breznakia pachnodae]